ncbi:MAG: hypoxanthine phosphoribosyltransferase [Oscillospiraceae bacterium]|nr:hypoxanthine phosphoribosyltransferase [Oscillospiraceae bacterium]
MHNDVLKVLISEQELREKVKELGSVITKDYAGKIPVVISVLKGSFVFVSDLVRAMDVNTEIDFLVVSSFAGGVVSTGAVRIIKDINISLEGRDVLVVEDILDSGLTLEYISEILKGRGPRSLRIATLLDKPCRRKSGIIPDYTGFVIPDEFVIGYGLDYDEKYRNLPYIGVLKPSVYSKEDAQALVNQKAETVG